MPDLSFTRFFRIFIWSVFILLIIGGSLYFCFQYKTNELDLTLKIDWSTLPKDLALKDCNVNEITIRVLGKKYLLDQLLKSSLQYKPDLFSINAGNFFIPIKSEKISLPNNISIIQIIPSAIRLQVEKKLTKELQILVRFSGKTAENSFISEVTVTPGKVNISGPESLINAMENIYTKPVDLCNASNSFKKQTILDFDKSLSMSSSRRTVNVKVIITEKFITNIFKNIKIKVRNTKYRFKITPPVMELKVQGSASHIEKLNPHKDIKVYIDLQGLKPGVYVRRVKIELPGNNSLIGVTPEVFTVTIEKTR
ncbi:putative YbbR family protein [Candidatus Magnetomoraceae bacterium gMMP-15]